MESSNTNGTKIGVVVIGRNEGERLIHCLRSVIGDGRSVVYVDSASTDDSVSNAKELGVVVLDLDMSQPFTAARARNEGFNLLDKIAPETEFVQFVDGDCMVDSAWFESATSELAKNPQVGIVCGRRRERFPEKSIYNYMCDLEWNTPIGDAKACGGDFMARSTLFRELNGFNAALIAGEEPELCIRVRQAGSIIKRIDKEMTLHDASMFHFRQWWKRSVRAGYAFAEGAHMYGKTAERHWVAESRRARNWAFIFPLFVLLAVFISPWGLLFLLAYPAQIFRLALRQGMNKALNWKCSLFSVLGKFPEMRGQLQFQYDRLLKSKSNIIEYK